MRWDLGGLRLFGLIDRVGVPGVDGLAVYVALEVFASLFAYDMDGV